MVFEGAESGGEVSVFADIAAAEITQSEALFVACMAAETPRFKKAVEALALLQRMSSDDRKILQQSFEPKAFVRQ